MMASSLLRIRKFVDRKVIGALTSPWVTVFFWEPFFWLIGRRNRGSGIDLTQLRRVLVVRLDEIGDIVLTTPFLRELRKNLPCAWITLIVKPEVFNLVETCPYVNEVLTYYRQHMLSPGDSGFVKLQKDFRALKFAILHLWKRRFDLALLPRWDTDLYNASLLIYLSGAKRSITFSEYVNLHKHKLNREYDKFFSHTIIDKSIKHEVEYNFEILRTLGCKIENDNLEVWFDTDDEILCKSLLERYNIGKDCLLIGLGPGATALKKRWPVKRFIEIIEWLLKGTNCKIVLLGKHANDISLGRHIEDCVKEELPGRLINAIDCFTLRQTAAMLKQCKLYIGNDSGILHIAAAMNVPVIGIFCWPKSCNKSHINSPYRFGPWKTKSIVLSPEKPILPCEKGCESLEHCIEQVTVGEAKEAVRDLLPIIRQAVE